MLYSNEMTILFQFYFKVTPLFFSQGEINRQFIIFKVKCEKYWPNNGECVEFEGISVKTTKEEYLNDFASRQIQLTKVRSDLNSKTI